MKAKGVESEIVASILQYCEAAGVFAKRRQLGAYVVRNRRVKSPESGRADIWGILKSGRHFECEVKQPGEEPRPEQMEWLRVCADAGALAFWTDSLDEFIEIVTRGGCPPRGG